MTEPPLPDQLLDRQWATLHGHRRACNKLSKTRGCSAADSAAGPLNTPPEFRRRGWHSSLALGTVPDGRAIIIGELLSYPIELAPELLRTMDQREGWWPDAGLESCGYARTEVVVEVAGETKLAITYLSNAVGRFHRPDLSLTQQAEILLQATPKQRGPRALGSQYLLDIHHFLVQHGHPDPELQALAEIIQPRLPPSL